MMATDRQAEIAASVAALQDLGPGYDQALAEGLVERIGADIDKRIAAGLGERVAAEVDNRLLLQLDRYAGCRHQRRRAKRMIRAERREKRADRPERQALVLPIASMAITLPITAIVLAGSPGVAAIGLMAMIWVVICVVNVAYALRKPPQP
jgi:Flp pilus assembly protein TadB